MNSKARARPPRARACVHWGDPKISNCVIDDNQVRALLDSPERTETCWFTFTVPEHKISGQLYPFFRPNQKVMAASPITVICSATVSGPSSPKAGAKC